MTLEPLEQRRLLTAVPPVLVTNVNTIAPSQPVTLTANMPAAATGTVDFMDGTTDVGSEAVSSPDSQAIAFDGLSGYVSLPSGSSGLHFTSGDFTIAFWFDPANADENTVVLDRGWAYNSQKGDIEFKINYESGKLDFQANTGSEGAGWLFGWDAPESALSASFNVGQWNQVVVTRQGYTYSMWMNGVLAAVATSNADISDADDTNPFLLGTGTDESGDPDGFFTGSVSELDIWTTGLAAPQVAALRNGGYVFASDTLSDYPDSSELLAGYHLSGDASDFSGNGYDGTPSSGVEFTGNSAAGAMATITTTLPNVGNSITAAYSGDGYGPSTSAAQSVVEEATTLSGISSEITNQPPNQSTPSPLTDGSLTQSVAFTTGSLNYVSNAVGNATVGVDASFEDASDYAYFTATLTLSQAGDEVATNTVYYSATGAEDGTSYRFTVPIDGQGLPTGTYSYEMDITPYHSDDSVGTTQSVYGTTNVLNRTGSIFGQGWNLDGLDQLVFDPTGYNATYVRSDGTMGYFTSSDGVDFTSPAGPFAYMQLTTDGDGNYFLNDPSTGTTEEFSSGSTFLTVTDHDGNVTTYSTTTGAGFTVTDPAGQVTTYSDSGSGLIDSIEDFDSRETDLGYDTTDFAHPELTSVTLPNPYYGDETQPVYGFGYGPNSGMMISYTDADGNESQFAYNLGGALATEMAADGTTTAYQAADAPGVLYQGDNTDSEGFYLPGYDKTTALPLVATANAVAVQTDESGAPTVYTFDTFGDPTSIENALGNTTIYDRDTNGFLSEMIQPTVANGTSTIAPTTYYGYTDGNLTSEQSPDGSTQTWDYTSYTTYGGQYDVPYDYKDNLGNYTAYTYDTSTTPNTADLVDTDQYAYGTYSYDTGQNMAADGGDPITTAVYTTTDNSSGVPLGLVYSTTDPDGLVSAFQYDDHGNTTATYNGQTLGPTADGDTTTWTFSGLAPNAARTYDIFVEGSTSGMSVSGASLVSGATESLPTSALGGDWNWLGRFVLTTTDPATPLVVSFSGTSTANVCLMEPMSTMAYNAADDLQSTIDPMGDISATGYDDLDRPVTASQGQALPADPTFHSAAFENVPQAPGMARTIQVYVVSSDHSDDYSFSDTAGSIDSGEFTYVGTSSTSLGGDWFYLGYLTLPASDASSTVTVSNSESSVSQYALLQQTDATVYDPDGNDLSDVDSLNRVSTYQYNTVGEQAETSQGQILPLAAETGDASFADLPQTPGVARTFDVYVYSTGTPSSSYTSITDGTYTLSLTSGDLAAGGPLGADWYLLGTVALGDTDNSSTVIFTGVNSADSQICIVQQTEGMSYTATGLLAADTNADGGTSDIGYDAVGEETSVAGPPPDPSAPTVRPVTSDVYDAIGRPTSETDPLGNVTAYSYSMDTTAHTDSVATWQGQAVSPDPDTSTTWTFTSLALSGDIAGNSGDLTYEVFVQGSGISLTPNHETSWTTTGTPALTGAALGSDWTWVGTVTIDADSYSSLTFSHSGSVTAKVCLMQQVQSDTDDADGDLISETDGAGDTTTYKYNPLDEPAQQTNPENDAPLGPIFDKAGLVASDTDLQYGAETEYLYNMLGLPYETIQPDPSSGTAGDGPVTVDNFNADGELLSESLPDPATGAAGGPTTTFEYDWLADQVGTTLPDPSTGVPGGTTTDTFDLDGEEVGTIAPSPTGSGTALSTFSFDSFGNEVSQSLPDPANGTQDSGKLTTTFAYDADHDTLSLTDPDSNTTSWTYDGLGDELTQSSTVALGYNSDGTVDTTTAVSSYSHDLDGNVIESVDADGRAITFSYDSLNREAGETWYTDSSDASSQTDPQGTDSFAYDVNGGTSEADNEAVPPGGDSLASVADYGYTYTITGNVQTDQATLAGTSKIVTLAAGYDYNNNITALAANINTGGVTATVGTDGTISFSGGTNDFKNTYSYDTLGDTTGIAQTGNGGNTVTDKNVAMSYDSDQQLSGVDMYQSSGTDDLVSSSTLGYDGDSDLTDLNYYTNTEDTGTPLAGYHWDCNAAGVVSDEYSRNDSSDGSSAADTYGSGSDWGKTAYSYDANAELTAATYTGFASSPTPPSDYSADYDPNGNRTSATGADGTGTSSTAEASSTNRLLFDGTYYYLYDAEGNRIAQYKITSGTDLSLGPQSDPNSNASDITIYTWNNANELTGAAHYNTAADWHAGTYTATGEYAITYGNDAFGQMVTRTAAIGNGTSAPSTTENFIYNGQNIALILDQYGCVLERELTGTAADQVFATEAVVAGVTNWLLTDNQGTVRDVVQFDSGTDTTNEVDHLVYGAFGQLTGQSASSASDQPTFYYNGIWQDPQTGLSKMGARWYDAVDSVFLKYDPIGFSGGQTNLMEFVGDSPTNFTDPSGMLFQWLTEGAHDLTQAGINSTNAVATDPRLTRFSPLAMAGSLGNEPALRGLDPRYGGPTRPSGHPVYRHHPHRPVGATSNSFDTGIGIIPVRGGSPGGGGVGSGLPDIDYVTTYVPPDAADSAIAAGEGAAATFFLADAAANAAANAAADALEGDALLLKCFPAGTLVATPRGQFPIESLKAGEEVWAYDLVHSRWCPRPILKTYVSDHDGISAKITVAGETIEATFLHPFWVVSGADLADRPVRDELPRVPEGAATSGRWLDAGEIRAGDQLLLRDGRIVAVQVVQHQRYKDSVYNLHVAELETYAIGPNGVLAHNMNGFSDAPPGPVYKSFADAAGVEEGAVTELDYIGVTDQPEWYNAGFTQAWTGSLNEFDEWWTAFKNPSTDEWGGAHFSSRNDW